MFRFPAAVALTILALSPSFPALAQTNFGQINGSVYDPTGNLISGAKIVIRNLSAEGSREAVSTNDGSFVIPTVPPALYSLSATAPGFQTYVIPEFRLQVNEARTFEVRMQLGQVAETVEVTAQAVAVNQTDATIGTVIQQQEIVEIPLNGRNFAQLILLAPGASPAAVGQQETFGITGGYSPAVNGMRHMMNNFTLDGVENNMRFTNSFGTPPPPDALEEFKVSSHQSDAAASLAAGANINLVTRSGTNEFHGSLWNFLRNDKLSANGFFNNLFGRGKLPFRQNQFGLFLGGPVWIPKLIDGRKTGTYISGYYEGTRFRRSSTTLATVPSDAVRRGDFSELLGERLGTDCLGRTARSGQIYDPFSTRAAENCPQGIVRDPFPNNQVPRIHPVAQAWLQYIYPPANTAGTPNLLLAQSTRQDSDQWGIRVDQNISERQRLFGRVSLYDFTRRSPTPLPANFSLNKNTGGNVAINYNFIFSPTLLYEFTGGYNRATIPFGNEPLGEDFRNAVGEDFSPEVPLGFLPSSQVLTGSRYNFASFVSYDLANPDDAFQFNNSIKKVAGKHSLSAGFNILHWRHFVGVQGTSNLQYSPLSTSLPGVTGTGESLASFYLGLPTQTNFGFGLPKKTYGNVYVAYIGDTWKIMPKLSVTLGLQYVYASPPRGNQVSAMDVDLARTQPLATDFTFAYIWAETNPITGAPPNASPGLLEPDRNNFAPRIALAYTPFANTSIRTGFGLFYDYNTNLIQNNNARGFSYPFAVSRSVTGQN
ncbi:MAG: carboxypeptidase regulatory-like domain-containing protein, partial [Bryobacteraceae bacterium]